MRKERGFTIIELLIVMVIIAILTSIALISFGDTKEQAFATTMRSDLRNLVASEESFYTNNGTYTDNKGNLADYTESDSVTVTISDATELGYSASAEHTGTEIECMVAYGDQVGEAGLPDKPGSVECS